MKRTSNRKYLMRILTSFTLALMICAGARAQTINTTLTVTNATGSFGVSGVSFTGQANLTGIGSGTISGSIPLTPGSGGNLNANFTITIGSDTIRGTLTIPATALGGGELRGSATITGGTGRFAGATGSFPNLTGQLSMGMTTSLSFSGAGTIITGGGGPVTPTGPTITDVLDAASYTKNIAQGSIFVVKGNNLSASGFTQFSFPLPTSSNNVRITFTPSAGGTGTDAYLVYLYNQGGVNQLAAVLPSTLATGNYNVRVTYNGNTSAPFTTQVVQRKIGLITADSSGTGLAVIQNFIAQGQPFDIGRYTTFSADGYNFSPSKPGQVLVAWATGLGAVNVPDNDKSGGFDFTKNGVNVQVLVGGRSITPLYAGRAPELAGADQINFVLPADVPTGCTVSFQVSVDGVLSNPTFIAIAPDANASACVQPGFTQEQLDRYSRGGTFTTGAFSLLQLTQTVPELGTVKFNTAGGQFTRFTGFQLEALAQQQAEVSTSGACTVVHHVSSGSDQPRTSGDFVGLDAGNVTLSGPSGSNLNNTAFTKDAVTNSYSLILGAEGLPIPGGINASLVPGPYTVRGTGGRDVGSFTASVTLGAPLNITGGLPSVVNRAAGLTLNWTGGNASDPVQIIGSSSTVTGTGANQVSDTWSFICTTNAGAGTFTVPSSVLTRLPAVAASSTGSSSGFLQVSSGPMSTFNAPLTAGGNIDAGVFMGFTGIGGTASYQ